MTLQETHNFDEALLRLKLLKVYTFAETPRSSHESAYMKLQDAQIVYEDPKIWEISRELNSEDSQDPMKGKSLGKAHNFASGHVSGKLIASRELRKESLSRL